MKFIPGETYEVNFPVTSRAVFIGYDNDHAVFRVGEYQEGYFYSISPENFKNFKKVPKFTVHTRYLHWYKIRPNKVHCIVYEKEQKNIQHLIRIQKIEFVETEEDNCEPDWPGQ